MQIIPYIFPFLAGTIRPAHQSTHSKNVTYAAHLMGYNRRNEQPGGKLKPF